MTIYVDVVLLENIAMNYIILFATAVITKSEVKILKILLASIIGGVYAILTYMVELNLIINLLLKIFLSIAMVYIAYKPKKIKVLLKDLILFYLVSFTFGGVSFMLLYFLKPQDIINRNGVYIGTYPLKVALLGGIVGFTIIVVSFKTIKGKLSTKNIFCEIEIGFKNNVQTVKTMIDSGNLLKEPITGYPVIIVEEEKLKNILSTEVLQNVENIIKGNIPEELEDINKIKFRLIPFTSIGKESGLLLGFKPDYIKISYEDTQKIISDVVVGIYKNHFTNNGFYSALIGIDILERSDCTNEVVRNVEI